MGMRAKSDEMEIRGKETKTSKAGKEYIIVRVEDETGKVYELCDHNMTRLDEYRKGRTCRFALDIEFGKSWTNVSIVGIVEA